MTDALINMIADTHNGRMHRDPSANEGNNSVFYFRAAIRDALEQTAHRPPPLLTPEMMARAIVSEPDWWQPGPEFLIDFDKLREHIAHAIAFDRGYRR